MDMSDPTDTIFDETKAPILEVSDLSVSFHLLEGVIPAVAGVDLVLNQGEVLGVVGESGCGKSVTARAVMRIISTPPGSIDSGRVLFEGRDLLNLSEREMELVHYLAANSGRAIARDELLANVWRITPKGLSTRTIDMHIARLREKLEADLDHPAVILTVRGKGYMFANDETEMTKHE